MRGLGWDAASGAPREGNTLVLARVLTGGLSLHCLPPIAVFRSNWLGAQGHEERKKMAEASARVQQHRGQMP